MSNAFAFADVLEKYVVRSGYTTGQLAKLSGVPKPTIVNWLEGRVRRPRGFKDLLRLTAVLHLNEAEATELLNSANQPAIHELRATLVQKSDPELEKLLHYWELVEQAPQMDAAPFQVMADLPNFVGRTAEIEAIQSAIEQKEATVYSIHGMGGVGKTVLAVHLAYRLRPYFPDGVLWARVDTSDTLSILGTFAAAFGQDLSQFGDVGSRSRVLRELIASRRVLIVLDNVETSEQVKPLLPPTGSCAVIVTTRRHDLSVTRRARRFILEPFNVQNKESLALFARTLGDERVAAEEALFIEIADLLGHLPLAVDIVASRLAFEPGWSTAEFLHRMRQEKRRLSELAFDDQNVRLSFNTSISLLTEREQQFFATLAICKGDDFSDTVAAEIADVSLDDARDMLRQLFALSLIHQGTQLNRYRLHFLLRDCALQMWTQLPLDVAALNQRFTQYFVEFLQTQGTILSIAVERQNIIAALHLANENGLERLLVDGVNAFYPSLEAWGLYKLAATFLQMAAQTEYLQADPHAELNLHHHLGRLAQRQGEYIDAETEFETAVSLARTLDDQEMLSQLLRALGVLAARRGDYVLADAYYKEGLSLAHQLGQGGIVSNFLRGLGVQAYMRGDYARAEMFYEEGLALVGMTDEEAQGPQGEAGTMWGLGVLAQENGNLTEAEQYFKNALSLVRQLGHQERVVLLLRSLASLAAEQDALKEANDYLAEAHDLAQAIGHRWQLARVLCEWGWVQFVLQETAVAQNSFAQLYEWARIMQSQELVAEALFGLAQVTAVLGDMPKAQDYGQQSLDTFTAIGHPKVQDVVAWLDE